MCNGYDGALLNGLLSLPRFDRNLGSISAVYTGLIIAGIPIGGLVGFLPAPFVADRIGRVRTSQLGALVMTVASLVQGLTRGPVAFLVTRIALGGGLAFIQTATAPLINELAPPRHRGLVGAGYNSLYYVGSIVSAWVTLATLVALPTSDWSWKAPCLVQTVFPLTLLVSLVFFVDESPRYLVSVGKEQQAWETLYQLRCCRGSSEKQDCQDAIEEYKDMQAAIAGQPTASYVDFVRTPGNRHRLLIIVSIGIMVQWSGNGIVSYYLSPVLMTLGVDSAVQRSALNGGLQVWNLLFASLGAYLADRVGRRPLWMLSILGMLVFEVLVTIASALFSSTQSLRMGYLAVVCLFLFFACYDLALTPLNFLYIVETSPFALRSKAVALNQIVSFAFAIFNQLVNPIALEQIAWGYYLLFIALLALFALLVWLAFPETRGIPLERVAAIFDGVGDTRICRSTFCIYKRH